MPVYTNTAPPAHTIVAIVCPEHAKHFTVWPNRTQARIFREGVNEA